MIKKALTISLLFLTIPLLSQKEDLRSFLADSAMEHAEVSFCIIDADSGKTVFEYNADKSLIPASVMKLVTTSAALEMLGPDYTFKTSIGYTGKLLKLFNTIDGNIVIKGGGDPTLGSENFKDHYAGFADRWIDEFNKLKVRKVTGGVITDDSYYDYLPVPAKWLWEDIGNYYGAGAYGLSVFDNTYQIHLSITPDSTQLYIKGITPVECSFEFTNRLAAAGSADKGYVFAAPYSTTGWLAGSVPSNLKDFLLKASIADPPLIMAKLINQKLTDAGIRVTKYPTTSRLMQRPVRDSVKIVSEISSPPLYKIVEVLNFESVNLYAEHLVKEIGKVYKNVGSTEEGIQCITEWLALSGIKMDGLFMEDGSGLSPLNAVNSRGIVSLLYYMKRSGKHFNEFYSSLPQAGREGTLKNFFNDPVFESRLKSKSGSMTRVRSYAGYFSALSGKDLIFCIIINNFSGPQQKIITYIEEILKEAILSY
jgi:D-alanyl-D-alanine carboxypeptidase/D-alanyl-D-alanine-endopeptidase (penicillin-binding protein 4)